MRVDCPHQIFDCCFRFHGGYRFGDQFGCLRADDVDTENLAVVGVTHDFDEALVLADDAGAAVGGEGEFPDFQVVPRFTGLGLREAYAADFGMAVGGSGNAFAVDRLAWFARDLRDCYQAFHGPDVRQLRRAQHDVADRVDARFVRALPRIDFDELAFRLDFGFFEADVLRARLA